MSQWHYADRNRQQHGPMEGPELARLFHDGAIAPDTLVWRDGLPGWQPLRDFAAELALLEPAPVASAGDTEPLSLEPLAPAAEGPFHETVHEAAPASPYAAPVAALHSDEGFHAGGEAVQAGFWKRVAAYVIDAFVVGAASQIVQMVMMVAFFGLNAGAINSGSNPFGSVAGILFVLSAYLVPLAIQAFYFATFHASSKQATLGKMAVGIKVVDSDGRRITLLRGIGRYFGFVLSSITLGIGFLMAAFTRRKQALHDLICGTQVVDKWAYTAHPEWQRRELGTTTVVILVIAGAMVVLGIVFVGMIISLLSGMPVNVDLPAR